MTEDLDNTLPPENVQPEPSPLPSSLPKVTIEDIVIGHQMLVGFKEAVREGQYMGSAARAIALGLDFLDRTINSSKIQLDMAKREEKEMLKRAKEAIKEAGGQIAGNEAPTVH